MATWAQHLAALESELGYHESPSKWTKFGAEFGKLVGDSSYATGDWCAMYQLVKAYDIGDAATLGGIDKRWAYVPDWLNYWQNAGLVGNVIIPGALAFYDFNGNGEPEHVGRVVQKTGRNTFQAIEGNTGNAVRIRDRNASDVLRFGYPRYGNQTEMSVVSLGV